MDDSDSWRGRSEEEAELQAGARRQLRFKLGAAGLLDPKLIRTSETDALEKQIRQEVKTALDASLRSLAEEGRQELFPQSSDEYLIKPDLSFAETMAYTWLLQLKEDAAVPNASSQLVEDWKAVKDWLEIEDSIKQIQFERFASGWVSYVRYEDAPTEKLREAWAAIRADMDGPTVALHPKLKGVYERLIASDEELEHETRATQPSDQETKNLLESERLKFEKLFNEAARISKRENKQPGVAEHSLVAAVAVGILAYPIFLGAHGRSLEQVAVFVGILAVVLFFFGPKPGEVQGNPSRPLTAIFSLILAAGLSAFGYGIGYFFLG